MKLIVGTTMSDGCFFQFMARKKKRKAIEKRRTRTALETCNLRVLILTHGEDKRRIQCRVRPI